MATKAMKLASRNAGRKYFIAAGIPMIGFLIGCSVQNFLTYFIDVEQNHNSFY
jgi:hypothetical protein